MQLEKLIAEKKAIHRRYTSKGDRKTHLEQWQKSGLSKSEYCRQKDIPLTSFLGWRRAASKMPPTFKPLTVSSAAPSSKAETACVVEIQSSAGIRIRLFNLTDVSLVAQLARELGRCS